MFWAAQAALIKKGITTKTHTGLISQFSKEYVLTGLMETDVFQSLQAAFDMRQESTYEVRFEVTEDEVKELLEEAEEFINSIKGLVAI